MYVCVYIYIYTFHSHLESHLAWCLLQHRCTTDIWNTYTKSCVTCNLTPLFGFYFNFQSTLELELKQDGQTMLAEYPFHCTMLLMALMTLNNIQHFSKMSIGRKAITILL